MSYEFCNEEARLIRIHVVIACIRYATEMAGAYKCLPCGSTLEIILVCTVISVDLGFVYPFWLVHIVAGLMEIPNFVTGYSSFFFLLFLISPSATEKLFYLLRMVVWWMPIL